MKWTIARYMAFSLALVACGEAWEPTANDEPLGTTEEAVGTGVVFGTSCQDVFEDDWIAPAPWKGTVCSGFNSSLDDVATLSYYTNLVGSKPFYEQDLDQLYLETVDIHFNGSHGSAWTSPARAVFTMWNKETRAYSENMKLGDETSRGLSVLVSHACKQLLDDGNIWTRWFPIMSGGLRLALAANGDVFSQTATQGSAGKRFADNLKAGQTFWGAWYSGLTKASSSNKPAALATGTSATNSADCWARLDGMKLDNFKSSSYGRIKDSNVKMMCWYSTQ